MKVAQKALKSCDTASLIECYEDFERRPLKDLAHAVREEDEELRENEELVIRVFFCLQAIVANTSESELPADACAAFCKGTTRPSESHADNLPQVTELLQSLIDEPCGEALFSFAVQTMAACSPVYGRLQLFAEQASIAHFICNAALPDMKPKDAFKKSVDSVFTARNLASIEALPTLCRGSGEGLQHVWKLVLATVEVVEEYIPEKDSENNYVGARGGADAQMSPSSPMVCAEYEVIEEQLAALFQLVPRYADEPRGRGERV